MKTLYTAFTLLFLSSLAFGQNIEINSPDDNLNYAGQTVTITGDDNVMSRTFYVKNTGTETTFYWSRTIVSSTSSSFIIQLCDDMICYNTSGPYWIGPEKMIASGDSLLFKPQITTSGSAGNAEVKYFVLDGNQDKIDSLTVVYTSTLSIDKNEQTNFSIYPNPAQDFINIKGDGLKNGGTVVFLDALGKEVKRSTVKSANAKLSVSDLKRGVYFVNIYGQNGTKSNIQRLIIQ